jgi:S-adenosylmethionine:tRNA ribosyltransferase-isomerase
VELLLEKEAAVTSETITWDALTKPGLKAGDTFEIPGSHVRGVCEAINGYTRRITFFIDREHFLSQLDRWAKTPIPPYIRWNSDDEAHLREVYQTVYAKYRGAVAAPTAGLHFTPALLEKIRAKGIQIEEVTLHVGLGTFLPVKTEQIEDHYMHAEWFELSQPTAEGLNEAKRSGKRIIAVGTTTVRVLESCSQSLGTSHQSLVTRSGSTQIYIYPPYQFKFVDSLITNFHTPKSTLLMLVSALASSPNILNSPFSTFRSSLIGKAYAHALENNYRFYSFGDAMWIR